MRFLLFFILLTSTAMASKELKLVFEVREQIGINCVSALHEYFDEPVFTRGTYQKARTYAVEAYRRHAELMEAAGPVLNRSYESPPVTARRFTEEDLTLISTLDPVSLRNFWIELRKYGGDLHVGDETRSYLRVVGEEPHVVIDRNAEGWVIVHEVVGHFNDWLNMREHFIRHPDLGFSHRPGYHAAKFYQGPFGMFWTEKTAIRWEVDRLFDELVKAEALEGKISEAKVLERIRYPSLKQALAFARMIADLREIDEKAPNLLGGRARLALKWYEEGMPDYFRIYAERMDHMLEMIVARHTAALQAYRDLGENDSVRKMEAHLNGLVDYFEKNFPPYCSKPDAKATDRVSQELRNIHLRYKMFYEEYRRGYPFRPNMRFVATPVEE